MDDERDRESDEQGVEDGASLGASIYAELRALAAGQMRRERRDHSLQATALVNEAYLRLRKQRRIAEANKSEYLAIAAHTMRRILVDHARARARQKRGGSWGKVSLSDASPLVDAPEVEVLALHEALKKLAATYEREAKVVELRIFGGLGVEETAQALGVTRRTVDNDWKHAKAWLRRELNRGISQ